MRHPRCLALDRRVDDALDVRPVDVGDWSCSPPGNELFAYCAFDLVSSALLAALDIRKEILAHRREGSCLPPQFRQTAALHLHTGIPALAQHVAPFACLLACFAQAHPGILAEREAIDALAPGQARSQDKRSSSTLVDAHDKAARFKIAEFITFACRSEERRVGR